jgi:hypothetical protein
MEKPNSCKPHKNTGSCCLGNVNRKCDRIVTKPVFVFGEIDGNTVTGD